MALTQVKAAGLTADLIDETKLADNSIDSEHYNDGSIDNEHLADDAVGIAELSASGTAGNTTYLRGDNTWTVPPDNNTVYTHPNHSGEVTSTADGAQVVANDVIDEANLKVDNSPTNDYVLTAKSSAAGGLTWAAASGGISDIVSDTSPQLGGDLDTNSFEINLDDSHKVKFGTSSELLSMMHNGALGRIQNNTGYFQIYTEEFRLGNKAGNESMIIGTQNGSVDLYFDNAKKAETVTGGFTVTGTCTATSFAGDGSSLTNISASDSTKLPLSGGTLTGNVEFGYGKKAGFGGDNLTIWHDGGNAYIENDGGDLFIHGTNNAIHIRPVNSEDSIKAIEHGAVELYHDDAISINTQVDGARITGGTYTSEIELYSNDGIQRGQIYATNGNDFIFKAGHGDTLIHCKYDAAVELFHDNTKTCETSANGLAFPSGKGIDFSATSDGSGTDTSELLDDYEEGTWVPLMGGSDNHSSYNVSGTGMYTKVGRLITITARFNNVNLSTSAGGNMRIKGLPYVPGFDNDFGSAIQLYSISTDSDRPLLTMYSSTSGDLGMIKSGDNNASQFVAVSNFEGSGKYFDFSMVYQTS